MTGKSRVETGGQQRGQRESSMSHQERLEALKSRHQALETAIAEEHAHSHPDEVRISNLKKQKLRIKDEIAGLSAH